MTCREKLVIEHPSEVDVDFCGGCYGCPNHYDYMDKPDYCNDISIPSSVRCTKCWDREIPDMEEIRKPLSKVTVISRDKNGKRNMLEFDSWDAVDVSGKDESEEVLLILIDGVCVYSKLAHQWITWEVVREFFA